MMGTVMKDAETPCMELSPVLDVFAARWKAEILWHLRRRPRRFNELRRLVGPVSQKMLATQLRALERDGLVQRKVLVRAPIRVEYSSTALALSVHPLLEGVYQWWRRRWRDVERARRQYARDRDRGSPDA
jgi:DNA-binding HxlR family transcriptional regulator